MRSRLRRGLARARVSWLTILWLTALWVLLWGRLSVANVLGGIAGGILITSLMPLPMMGYHGRVRPLRVFWLVLKFAIDITRASFQVAFLVMRPRHLPRGAVIGVQLRSESDMYLAFTAEIATLIPGSVVVEALRANGMVYVHLLDVDLQSVDEARESLLAVEERVLRALASEAELVQAGFPSKRRRQRK